MCELNMGSRRSTSPVTADEPDLWMVNVAPVCKPTGFLEVTGRTQLCLDPSCVESRRRFEFR